MEYNGYVGAPYNFIEMNSKVYGKKEIQPHDVIDNSKHTGEIEYEVEAITPVMVDDGKGNFYTNIYNEMAIPGSTMRGLVRNNMQILSFSSFAGDIQDGRLMYRNVAAGKERKRYNEILKGKSDKFGRNEESTALKMVRAGYIRNDGGKYFILQTEVDSIKKETGLINYYEINEKNFYKSSQGKFDFMIKKNAGILQSRNGGNSKNPDYHPYMMPISYELINQSQISGIDAYGVLRKNGYLVSTGKMFNGKKIVYVIPAIDETKEKILLASDDIDYFKRDYEGRKTQVEAMEGVKNKGFFNLPRDGETKPVFYIEREMGKDGKQRYYIGFTPRLRLLYDKTIYDGIASKHKDFTNDYCKSIFGYTNDDNGYKSRVSFSDALTVNGNKMEHGAKLILGSPKPTDYLDYLIPANHGEGVVSYNDEFEIRGVKQYWLKNKSHDGGKIKNFNAASVIKPCVAGTKFKGKIRFENLSDNELGMLLWSLLLEKRSNQNIGKAKPYGYGRIAVKLSSLKLLNYDEMYGDSLSLSPYEDSTDKADDFVKSAKDDMTAFLGQDVMQNQRIKHFLLMKDATKIPPDEKTRYMSLSAVVPGNPKTVNEFSKRDGKIIVKLPTVEEVVEGKPLKAVERSKAYANNGGGHNKGNNVKKK
jgi:CRISPR-associated protein (TIGR03986 family)